MQHSDQNDNELQSNLVRMNLNVSPDVPEKLRELSGGRFKMGTWLSELISQIYDNRLSIDVRSMDVEGLRLTVLGLAGQLQSVQGELMRQQSQIAALIAKG